MTDIVERFERAVAANGYRTRDEHTEQEYELARSALRQLISEADKREKEARAKTLGECVKIIDKVSVDIRALEKVNRSYVSRMLHIASMEVRALQSEDED